MLHNLPIVWDIRAQYPNARIDWLVEESYVSLLEPLVSNADFKGLDHIIPIAIRRWKKNLLSEQTRKEWRAFRQNLQARQYDVVVETQGLLKTAWLSRLATRSPDAVIAGLGNATVGSGYEPIVRWFYTDSVQVPLHCHAVARSRWVAAAATNVAVPTSQPQFYPAAFLQSLQSAAIPFDKPYVLLFHATARAAKQWSESNWIALGNTLARQGKQVILPWGNVLEKVVSERLSAQIAHSIVSPAFNINEWFSVIANAALTVGVDTGLTHLSAMMNTPTIELYCDSPRWKTEAYWSGNVKNLGDEGQPPSLDEVLHSVVTLLVDAPQVKTH